MTRLKQKKGFTLTEVVVALGIFGVLIAAMGTLFSPIVTIAQASRYDTYTDSVQAQVGDYLRKTLDTAAGSGTTYPALCIGAIDETFYNEYIAETATLANYSPYALVIKDGRLYDPGAVGAVAFADIAGENYAAFLEAFYNNADLSFTFEEAGPRTLRIIMTASRDGERITRDRTSSFTLLTERAGLQLRDASGLAVNTLPPGADFLIMYRKWSP